MITRGATCLGRYLRLAIHPELHNQTPDQPPTSPERYHGWNCPQEMPFALNNGGYRNSRRKKPPHQPTPSDNTEPNPGDIACRHDGFLHGLGNALAFEVEPMGFGCTDREVPHWECDDQYEQRPEVPNTRNDVAAGWAYIAEPMSKCSFLLPQSCWVQNTTLRTRDIRSVEERLTALLTNEHYLRNPLTEDEFIHTEAWVQEPVNNERVLSIPPLEVLATTFRASRLRMFTIERHKRDCRSSLQGVQGQIDREAT